MKSKRSPTTAPPDWTRESLANELYARFGPLVGGNDLAKLLGFTSTVALRQAEIRETLGVKTFGIENRRGRFAFTQDVSKWLADLRLRTCNVSEPTIEERSIPPQNDH